jgi:mono/diheme cytochrome c family protein
MSRQALAAAVILAAVWASGVQAQIQASGPNTSWTLATPKPDPSLPPLVSRGHEVFLARCQLCHGDVAKDISSSQGTPMTGTLALQAKYKGSKPALLEQRTDLTPDSVGFFVRHGSGIMPFFRPTEVSDDDLKALEAYLTYRGKKPAAVKF